MNIANTLFAVKSLKLRDFRCFASFELTMNEQGRVVIGGDDAGHNRLEVGPLTVLVARNGRGKTTVLDALRILLSPYVCEFVKGSSAHANESDIRLVRDDARAHVESADGLSIGTAVVINGQKESISREFKNGGRKTTTKLLRPILHFAQKAFKRRRAGEFQPWPLIAFYGTGRLWATKKGANHSDLAKKDIYGYENCLTQVHDFRAVRDWLTKAVRKIRQERDERLESDRRVAEQYACVRGALELVLANEGYSADLSVDADTNQLAILNPTPHGFVPVPVTGLSDGVKAVFSLVSDIALRCARLNPCYGAEAARQTEGVVMIDEVELHLHPAWQQTILSTLQRAFPKLQFIVTTHSPQVVSSVPKDCVRILTEDGGCDFSTVFTEGATSAEVLRDVFGVPLRVSAAVSQVSRDLEEYRRLVYANEWSSERAQRLKAVLEEVLPGDPELTELALEVQLRDYQRRHADEAH